MSFFRNWRSSITRGRSSSRDTTPVRNSGPGSVISSLNSGNGKRRDSIESRTDSLLNRSETFILDDPDDNGSHSNCSTLEKKSKKSKVLEKFSTFTKRKKTPPTDKTSFEHHPSDNATNTYYKWQADGGNSLDYDSQNDPFNFLYEQQSTLKSLHNNESLKTSASPTYTFDSSTYRKGKMPNDLKKQLKVLKQTSQEPDLLNKENDYRKVKDHVKKLEQQLEEQEKDNVKVALSPYSESDKYKTVTLNSFRKSFREKFLQQQKEAAHNPAWFVEVDTNEMAKNKSDPGESSKENRRDLLVFENDNYRPGSRSPIRDLGNRKPVTRTPTRSPVKRNETFKVERESRIDQINKTKPAETTPSIRIEFKNSVTPNIPGRMVPVGVAKPMPSQLITTQYYPKPEPLMNTSYTIKSAGITTTRLNNDSPIRKSWSKTPSPSSTLGTAAPRPTRYQTLVQIKNDKTQQVSPITVRNSRLSTRIQLGGPSESDRQINITSLSPTFGKSYNSTYLFSSNGTKSTQPSKQSYFGEITPTARVTHTEISSLSSPTRTVKTRSNGITPAYGVSKNQTPSSTLFASSTALTKSPLSRTTPTHSAISIGSSSSSNNLPHQKQQQQQHHYQHHSRILGASQRRSRSPIKIPWR